MFVVFADFHQPEIFWEYSDAEKVQKKPQNGLYPLYQPGNDLETYRITQMLVDRILELVPQIGAGTQVGTKTKKVGRVFI